MKKFSFALLLLSISQFAHSQESVDELLELLGGRQNAIKLQQQFVINVTARNPELKPYEAVLRNWAQEYFTWEAVSHELEIIYTSHYSDQEIQDLLEFYRTPTGRKSIELMPILFREGAKIGTTISKRHEAELRVRLSKAMQVQQSQ
ncbi:DUF2059 domain-containing protein [Alginatibacterium sediminis]|uniref:DUF2059 domain-containing protein n=1 Tax=Alginatibacterium sediminis TaxID=2164068 RepID=A0A420ECW1_9ALTE|nr:DUF2059 domain-containing protein [Alginatibacterium sediminis]RKF18462.1 DUF2059 domain-containing protein [Alginatibacterium sediminis]